MLSKPQIEILSAICYSAVFSFPLKLSEIRDNSMYADSLEQLKIELDELERLKLIQQHQGYFLLTNTDLKCIENRREGEKRFHDASAMVLKYSSFISKFPFVSGVYISGSYSKGVLDKNADVDYFIITKPGRLWICRTFLRGYKKFFLKKSAKYFCVNYFLDSSKLKIPDENRYVAYEIKTLIPAFNFEMYVQLQVENTWCDNYLPNKPLYTEAILKELDRSGMQNAIEKLLSGKMGNYFENVLFEFMEKRRKRLFKQFSEEEFNINMRTEKHSEKHHPGGTQKKVLFEFNKLLSSVAQC